MEDRDPRRMVVRLAVAMMAAHGRITSSELSTAEELDRLGLGPLSALAQEEIDRAVQQPIDLADTCRGLAKLSPYRAALERYNPNKVIDLGTEFASLAVQKLAQATAAFEFARTAAEREVA